MTDWWKEIPEDQLKELEDVYNAPNVPNEPTIVDSFYNVQDIQSDTPAPQPQYDVQSIQGQDQQQAQISYATPTEQAAAQGGGVPERVLPYFADLGSGVQYLYSQWPYSAGAVGTPTEQRYAQMDAAGNYVGYGPSSYQWSESPGSLAELAQGRTPAAPALAAADTVASFLVNFGVRPGFVTPFVTQSLGLTATDMARMGYVQDLYGQWIALEFGEDALAGDEAAGGGYYYGGGGGGGGRGYRYRSPVNFRSGYTSGLINWRIGI
jgi:hypothetical protein